MNRKILISGLLVLFLSTQINAQEQITEFLKAGKEDAKVLSEAYITPVGRMLGSSLNGGWYNTASTHSLLGFDVKFEVNISTVSQDSRNFDVNGLNLSKWKLQQGSNNQAPTLSGKMDNNRPVLLKTNSPVLSSVERLEMPNGLGWDFMPMPMLQAGVGLPFHTEIIGRGFIPIRMNGFSMVNFGVGLKHDIKEDLPVIKHLPFFQLSGLAGYTHFGMNYDKSDKNIGMNLSAFTARLITGIDVPFIAVYLGLGYGNTSCKFNIKDANKSVSSSINNGSFDSNLGLRLKLGLLTIHGDYTFGTYPVISAGVGVTFR